MRPRLEIGACDPDGEWICEVGKKWMARAVRLPRNALLAMFCSLQIEDRWCGTVEGRCQYSYGM